MEIPNNPLIKDMTADTLFNVSESLASLKDHLTRQADTEDNPTTSAVANGLYSSVEIIKQAVDYEAGRCSEDLTLPANQLIRDDSADTLTAVNHTLLFLEDYCYHHLCSEDGTDDKRVYAGLGQTLEAVREALEYEIERL